MIQALRPSHLHACKDNGQNGGKDDKSLLLFTNVGLTVEGFIDKYQIDSDAANLCQDKSKADCWSEDNDTINNVDESGN